MSKYWKAATTSQLAGGSTTQSCIKEKKRGKKREKSATFAPNSLSQRIHTATTTTRLSISRVSQECSEIFSRSLAIRLQILLLRHGAASAAAVRDRKQQGGWWRCCRILQADPWSPPVLFSTIAPSGTKVWRGRRWYPDTCRMSQTPDIKWDPPHRLYTRPATGPSKFLKSHFHSISLTLFSFLFFIFAFLFLFLILLFLLISFLLFSFYLSFSWNTYLINLGLNC